ncbi:hypothetical protein K5E19_16530 [Enterobacter sp. RIT637]|uniref:hypothetical protein n=1 Tax=Enterobacter sp. RIT637 TaxID=2870470 RepID=UPI001C88C56D|nr:hypothetical protein [Enterobacter sp. RIT637]MBX8462052.1 hypothetical protein [Enterobacter sp. RIT637]
MNILRTALIVLSVFNLTGCLTINLSNTIRDSKYYTEESLFDTVTDIYVSKHSSHSIQLGGMNSSFLVLDGSAGLKTLLSSSLMNVNNLSLKQNGGFSLYKDSDYTKIYVKIDVLYSFSNTDEAGSNELLSKTECQPNALKECVFEISDLMGDYNQKPVRVEEQNVIHLQKPLVLNMKRYTEHTPLSSYALMLLYPVTILLDAVTIPVQIFIIPFGMGTVGK